MDRLTAGCVLGIVSVAAGIGIAKAERAVTSIAAPAVSADEAAIAGVLTDLYACISGPVGQERDWETFDRVFVEGARLSAYLPRLDGAVSAMTMTPAEYKERSGPILVNAGFTEQEVHRKVEIFGSIAHAFSTYTATYTNRDGEAAELAGINSIQLVKTSAGWQVHSILWQQADEANPIPSKYMPADG